MAIGYNLKNRLQVSYKVVMSCTPNYMYMQWNYHETSSNGSGAKKAESWKAPTDQRKTFTVFAMCNIITCTVFHKIEGKFAFIFLCALHIFCCNVYATEYYTFIPITFGPPNLHPIVEANHPAERRSVAMFGWFCHFL